MKNTAIKDRLLEIGRKVVSPQHFNAASTMTNLPEWTSLMHIQLLGEVAHAFEIDIELDEAYRLDSFERLCTCVADKLAEKRVSSGFEYAHIAALFHARARAFSDRTFLVFPKEGVEYDYGTCYALASAAARRLESAGLAKGDRLCVTFANSPEFLLYYFAAHLLGVVLVPINPALSASEIAFIIGNSGSRLALFDQSLEETLTRVGDLVTDCRIELAGASSVFGLDSLANEAPVWRDPVPNAGLDDIAVILYTSGTTGSPKGVALSHRNFLSDSLTLANWFGFANETRTLCVLPMFHNNGQVITLLSPLWVGGSTVILEPRSALMSFWKMIDRYRVQWTSVMPAFLSAFLEHGAVRSDKTLQGIVCGGQVLLDEVRNRFEQRYGVPVFEGYGLTETTSFASMNRYPAEHRQPGSIGAALPFNEMKIVDEDGREAANGEVGEVLIKGDNVARHYHALPEVTQERFHDGWLRSGDYGYRDASGHFYFATRLDDLIIKGGENIYPAELENILHRCDDVVECAAVGIPDQILGQEVCLFVKLREGSEFDAEKIRKHFSTRIARFKQPRYVVVLDERDGLVELPKGPTRKILRRRLREHFLSNSLHSHS
jgi:acyl-CoA synthetase (AMP-forming)/AMP-acid ligase II/acyl carrier protein